MRPRVVGMIGGGQLARLSAPAAQRLGIELRVLDPSPDCPAARAGLTVVRGRSDDRNAIRNLVTQCDVTTFETEYVDTDALIELADLGHRITPDPRLMQQLTNKLTQKRLLRRLELPTTKFTELASPSVAALRSFGLPAVVKRQRGGYDGRGVLVIRNEHEADGLWRDASLIETYLADVVELAVLVVRAADGETRVYPVAEMVFSPVHHALDHLIVPAEQPSHIVRAAQALALRTISAIGGVGLFAVEMFVTPTGEIVINEIAPRAHNSGHYTIEACVTSQFEQHLRAVIGDPLGAADLLRPAAMINLIGSPGCRGPTTIEGWDGQPQPDAAIHLYEKRECWPGRKMGHVTALGSSGRAALLAARSLAERIRVRGAAS